MNEYRVYVTAPAENDIREIARYIRKQLREPGLSANIIDKIEEALNSLTEMLSRVGLVFDERLMLMGIRNLPVKSYSIFFRIYEARKLVVVERVLYSRRDWMNIL